MRLLVGLLAAAVLAGCGRPVARSAAPPVQGRATSAASPSQTEPRAPFAIRSDIPDCLEVVSTQTATKDNLLLAIVRLKTVKLTAACGCTSKWLLYRSVTSTNGLEFELASGTILAADVGATPIERAAVLLGDRAHPPAEPLILRVGCAPAP